MWSHDGCVFVLLPWTRQCQEKFNRILYARGYTILVRRFVRQGLLKLHLKCNLLHRFFHGSSLPIAPPIASTMMTSHEDVHPRSFLRPSCQDSYINPGLGPPSVFGCFIGCVRCSCSAQPSRAKGPTKGKKHTSINSGIVRMSVYGSFWV